MSAPGLTGEAGAGPRLGDDRLRVPRLRLGRVAALTGLAALVLAGAVLTGIHLTRQTPGPVVLTGAGTAFLSSTTCADWQRAGDARRLTITQSLAAAATGPDPENRGATLTDSEAYVLFQRACSTRLSESFLLYEIYNRAAIFRRGSVPTATRSGALSNP